MTEHVFDDDWLDALVEALKTVRLAHIQKEWQTWNDSKLVEQNARNEAEEALRRYDALLKQPLW